MSEFYAADLSALRVNPFGSPDLSRPECRNLHLTIQDQKRQRKRWSDRYQSATSIEAKQDAARNIEQIDDRIAYYEDQMHLLGCFEMPTTVVRLLGLDRPELTQSTQYHSNGGQAPGRTIPYSSSRARPSLCASI